MKPDLSIVIPSFNTRDVTLKCIEKIIGLVKLDYELIIVDNASIDGTGRAITKLTLKYSQIKLISNIKNLGFAKAVNLGINKAKAGYILLLNSDVFVQNGSVEKLLDLAKNKPDCAVVGGKLILKNGKVQSSVLMLPTVKSTINQYWFKKTIKTIPDKTSSVEAIVGAVFLLTPIALKRIGLFDEKYFMYFEDLDYCRRVKDAGLKIYYHPQAIFTHLHGQSGKSLVDKANQWKRLVPGSKIYHGRLRHYLITLIIWIGQKVRPFFG